jgi:hypothetical protein
MGTSEVLLAANYNGQQTTDHRQSGIDNQDNGPRTTDHGLKPIGNGQSKIDDRYNPAASGFSASLRDPFKLPPPPRPALEENDPVVARNRRPGPRGLLIAQLRLKGVVRDSGTQKMIAVVINSSNRAYFLREGETVYDGMVSKITPDAVYFKENVLDAKHEMHSREVVKVLNPAPGEVR